MVDVEGLQQLPGDAFGAGQDRFDRCAADQVGQAAYHSVGPLVQVLVQRGQCSGLVLVLVQAQSVFEGEDQPLPFTGQRQGQRGDEGETPGDLPAADAGEQALVFQVDTRVDERGGQALGEVLQGVRYFRAAAVAAGGTVT